jgi:hypothetical protein
MHGEAHDRRTSSVALVPMAAVALVVLLLALLVSGNESGTIVLEKIAFSTMTTYHAQARRVANSFTQITQTAPNGTLQRGFTSSGLYRSGDQQVFTPQGGAQLYDAHDNTIFATTDRAIQRALNIQARDSAPPGSHVATSVGREQYLSAEYVFFPGKRSIFEQGVARHQYVVAGRALIDGRPALRLVRSRSSRLALRRVEGGFTNDMTVYVAPETYDPIEEIVRTKLGSGQSTTIERWLAYRVMPATSRNMRLLSLRARHPHARIVHDAGAYLRAGRSQMKTMRWTVTTSG